MSFFRNLSNTFFGDAPPPIRPIKDVLPDGRLTDDEVCHYLIKGSDMEKTRTEEWLYYKKFSKIFGIKTHQYFDLKENIAYAYDDAINDFIINVRKGSFKEKATLNTYFNTIFKNKVNDIFAKKKTNKSKEETPWYTNHDATIEEKFANDFGLITQAIEPNYIEELLDLFEQKEPHVARWIRLLVLGWKDVDFVDAKMSVNDNSARSYMSNCRTQFKLFLKEHNEHLDSRNARQNKLETPIKGVKMLMSLIISTIIKALNP